MTTWLWVAVPLVWLLALVWVVQDAYASFPRSGLMWWGLLTLLLGPIAIPLYLSERMSRRAQMNKVAPGKGMDFPAPEGRRPFRPAGLRLFDETGTVGSAIFVVVQQGPDAREQAEIPREGALIVRRAIGAEKSHMGLLVLHDPAVSRDRHCRLWLANGRVMLEDTSRYGTRVDGTRIVGNEVEVRAGAAIRIGKTILAVRKT